MSLLPGVREVLFSSTNTVFSLPKILQEIAYLAETYLVNLITERILDSNANGQQLDVSVLTGYISR